MRIILSILVLILGVDLSSEEACIFPKSNQNQEYSSLSIENSKKLTKLNSNGKREGAIMQNQEKILIILSGGGAPGIETHIGFLQALEEKGVDIAKCYYRCASAGANVGGMAVSGYDSKQMRYVVKKHPFDDLISFDFNLINPFSGHVYDVFNSSEMDELIDSTVDEVASKAHMIVSVTNGLSGRSYLATGSKLMIKASKSVEEVLTPQYTEKDMWEHCDKYGQWWLLEDKFGAEDNLLPEGTPLVDGGTLNNVPTPPIVDAVKWDKIYISLCVDDSTVNYREGCKLVRAYKWQQLTRNREFYDVKVSDWPDLATVIQPSQPPKSTNLLEWSENQWLIDYSYQNAKKALEEPSKFAVKRMQRSR